MVKDMISSTSLVPVSELLSQTVIATFDTVHAAKEVLIQKENFQKFLSYLEKIKFILKELLGLNLDDSKSLENAVEILNREIKVVKQLTLECRTRSKVYLLISCGNVVKVLEGSTKEIGRALTLIPLAALDVSLGLKDQVSLLSKDMLNAEYRAAAMEEDILAKIQLGIEERNTDRSYANNLLDHISKAVGISTEQFELKKEIEELKREREDATMSNGLADATQMEQVIALLEKADATCPEEKEKEYFRKRNSLGSRKPLEPLQSFYCPITLAVMVDPVETSSCRTFERSAIEKWYAEGNNLCPLTMIPVNTSVLKPNKTLRQSIEEWKNRNTIITIASIKPILQASEEQEMLQSLCKLQDICIEKELHRDWVTMEEYIPVLIGLLNAKNREIRMKALFILFMLAKDSEDNKERIAKVDKALESIVHSLARQIGESKLALQLLLELSRSIVVRDSIGTVQGYVLLLVAILGSDDIEAAKDAEELLENLSVLDQNVILMAKASHFKPLIRLLSSGPENVRMIMAETLSEIELTDHNKLSIFEDGALSPLLQLLSNGDLQMKKVAVKALLHLSNLPQNGLRMIREGAVGPLFELLYCHSLSSPTLREQVAATIMHLAISTTLQEADQEQVFLLESEEDIFKLFSLISLTGTDIQKSILITFHAMCQSPSGFDIRMKLRQLSAVQVLVQLCEINNHTVRTNAVKLFHCLAEDGDDRTFLEHVGQRCIETLLRIIETSNDAEEIAAAMGIITNLPKETQLNQWLVDAGAIQTIFTCLTDETKNTLHNRQVIENAVGALCRFTVSTNQEWQKRVAETGIIPVLVQLLVSGTASTRQNAAISLKQFSESSSSLSRPIKKHGIFHCCLATPETGCPVHLGICTVDSSFCILEANALEPLIRMLGESNPGSCEASLDAILTLIDSERQGGSEVLAEANAILPIIKLLSSSSDRLQEKTLIALERIFQLEQLKKKYGNSAQMPLVEIAQKKNSHMKSLAAKVLAQLNELGKQSSYFG
ncbi:U-box domain-containing protein 44-like isoform X1 [Juglans microcarpa x Juglans regia]|uniref:U-box domain-containing protein 44-like isoform X1 n=2 Tax=Juglans microcarpa x Juglans regia TaxID=2249226 RepID=UPI001B7E8FCA|nr:U-box domain-containing protein 44-like isoform X1 [Juglans microcarpa x Juglans regia]